MKTTLRSILLVTVLAALFAGCSIYHPQAVDIPLINHNGDTRVDASLAMSWWLIPGTFTANATVSHAFNDWLAGQLHGNYGGDNFYLQGAPGAYLPLGEHSVLEGYVGLGFGGAWGDNRQPSGSSTINNNYSYNGTFLIPFGQANIGWHDLTKAHIDLGFGLKVGGYLPEFSYYELNDDGTTIAGSGFNYNTANLLLEPQLMARIGGEHVKFKIGLGMAWLSDVYGKNSNSHNLYSDFVSLSAGLTFAF